MHNGFSTLFAILCITMNFDAIKAVTFPEMGGFLLNRLNFSLCSAAAAPIMCYSSPFPHFRHLRRRKMCRFRTKVPRPL